jgi:DNA-binding CsgD family transcriptional regulator
VSGQAEDLPGGFVLELEGETFLFLSIPRGELDLSKLTRAQRKIAFAAAKYKTDAQIARALGLARTTVANHMAAVRRKLRVSRAELIARLPAEDDKS